MEICNEKMTIVQGEKIDLPLTIMQSNGKPYDLTSATEIKFCIKTEDNTVLEKTLTATEIVVDNATLAEITVKLLSVDTASLEAKDAHSFDVEISDASNLRIAKFERLLNVEERICS
jgi:hypothetical protein